MYQIYLYYYLLFIDYFPIQSKLYTVVFTEIVSTIIFVKPLSIFFQIKIRRGFSNKYKSQSIIIGYCWLLNLILCRLSILTKYVVFLCVALQDIFHARTNCIFKVPNKIIIRFNFLVSMLISKLLTLIYHLSILSIIPYVVCHNSFRDTAPSPERSGRTKRRF